MTLGTCVRIAVATIVANVLAIGLVWACGPFIATFATVSVVDPPDPAAFVNGEIGVLRPRFRRETLAVGYRTLSGQPPLNISETSTASEAFPGDDFAWRGIPEKVLAPATANDAVPRTRRLVEYSTPPNCTQNAFDTAVATFELRQQHYGAGSASLRAWVEAQAAVFANCQEEPLMLPVPAPSSADALARSDRAYQTAAAYFYGMQYDEAARRFRAIGGDVESPWREYGRYLAARSLIRTATMGAGTAEARQQALKDAEQELLAVIRDPIAAPLQASAKGLLRFVRVRSQPFEELRAIATRLTSTTGEVSRSELNELTFLLDREIGNTIDFDYTDVPSVDRLRESHDLIDWIVAIQGRGPAARDRAVARWRETRSVPWLVAALTHLQEPHESASALLDAAAGIPPSSPSFATVAFLRVRLLIALDQKDAARGVLATLPDTVEPGVSAETINLYRAERLMTALSLDEFLVAAPRQALWGLEPTPATASFDEDSATVLESRFTLDRLIDSGISTTLPSRLRARVAVAGFTRAIVLDRHDVARRIAPVLKTLAPQLAADIDRYLQETTPAGQKRAAVLLILRTPGMTPEVPGLDDSVSIDYVEPRRIFGVFTNVWWCGKSDRRPFRGSAASELIHTLYPDHTVPYPAFVTAEERAVVERELAAIDATGPATRFLATAALEWARERPADPDAAEALGRIVSGWRRACRDQADADLSRRSFQALHRQFPNSEWAKRNKYWYR